MNVPVCNGETHYYPEGTRLDLQGGSSALCMCGKQRARLTEQGIEVDDERYGRGVAQAEDPPA